MSIVERLVTADEKCSAQNSGGIGQTKFAIEKQPAITNPTDLSTRRGLRLVNAMPSRVNVRRGVLTRQGHAARWRTRVVHQS
jgi:hypothetical protein